jgi:hypothetical protein
MRHHLRHLTLPITAVHSSATAATAIVFPTPGGPQIRRPRGRRCAAFEGGRKEEGGRRRRKEGERKENGGRKK